jgi:hypothetical protein
MKRFFNITVATFFLFCLCSFTVMAQEEDMGTSSRGARVGPQRKKPAPKPQPDDPDKTFITLAQELDRLQILFDGGDGQPLTFDSESARRQGFSTKSINLAEQIVAFTNRLQEIARESEAGGDAVDQIDAPKERAGVMMQRAAAELEEFPALTSFFASASQHQYDVATSEQGGVKKSDRESLAFTFETPATVCGGFLTPRPTRAAPWVSMSNNNPSATLYQWGYHPAPNYAGGGWTRPQTYRPDICKRNSFRDHALIPSSKAIREQKYTGWSPNGEPNPEVSSYSWPYPAWPAYVYWWHQTH